MRYRSGFALWVLVTAVLGVSADALGQGNNARSANFQLILQTTGEWSGNYTGQEIGFSDHTIILYDYRAGCIPEAGPEYVDMVCHLRKLTSAIEELVPVDYDGLVIMDFESWPLSLYNQYWPSIRDPRIERQLQLNPQLTYKQAEDLAAALYLPYVQDFYLNSLRTARALRPTATWGFYSGICGDRWLPTNAYRRWVNDQSNWLWDEVDVICPYGYTGVDEGDPRHEIVEELVVDKTAEAVRLAESVERRRGARPLVLTYLNPRIAYWGISQHEGNWVSADQMLNTTDAAFRGGADGIVLWQSVRANDKFRRTEPEYVEILDTIVFDAVFSLRLGRWSGN